MVGEHSRNDERLASAFMDMEGEVADLDRMGEIADCLTMEWMQTTVSPPRQAELAACAVQQLHRLLNEFKTKYYRAFEGDNEGVG